MAAVPYLVMVPTPDQMPARNLVNGVEGMVVVAESAADAKAMCKSQFEQDVDTLWTNATATAIVADTDLHGWVLDILINKPDGTIKGHVTVTADGTSDPAVKATQTLTNDGGGDVADTQTVVIGSKTYTLQSSLTNVDGHVKIGASVTATITNLFNAINLGAGTPGTDYAAATTANTQVDAISKNATTLVVRAKTAGVAGNAIATTETADHYTWGAATLTGGQNSDTFDTLGTAAVTALNAVSGITHAAYNASTNVLTVAGTADNLGDHDVIVSMFPVDRVRDTTIPGAIGTVVDNGATSDALTVAFGADAFVIPLATAGLRTVA